MTGACAARATHRMHTRATHSHTQMNPLTLTRALALSVGSVPSVSAFIASPTSQSAHSPCTALLAVGDLRGSHSHGHEASDPWRRADAGAHAQIADGSASGDSQSQAMA